jgi:putative transcriptional regulator
MFPKSRILLLFFVFLLAGARGLAAQSKNPQDLAPGRILVARRSLTDPLFVKSVILLVLYGKSGALGLMVNRQTTVPISRALSGLKAAAGQSDPVFVGGPVELDSVFALTRAPRKPGGARGVAGDIYFVETKTALEHALGHAANPGTLRIYLGYCGWAPHQLENEVLSGAWYIFNGSQDLAFDAKPATLWSRLIVRAHEHLARLGFTTVHRPPLWEADRVATSQTYLTYVLFPSRHRAPKGASCCDSWLLGCKLHACRRWRMEPLWISRRTEGVR